ncbi:MAG: 4Fe-4S dicluster domain-containing protein [Burkholderiales bacterium]|nr:4Fe-4S dicluster domain-containing protein [Burkholderiales bacterium]
MSNYTNKDVALYFDSSKCTGCKGCQVACKQWNTLYSPLGLNEQKFTGSYQAPLDLNGQTRLVMTFGEQEGTTKKSRPVEWAFGRKSCFHCSDPACVEICPSGCLQKQANGIVTVDAEKCIGCKYCQQACPFDVPKYDEFNGGKVEKCTMCYERLENGRLPACVQTCQPEALQFGPRDEMLDKAHKRVDWLKNRGYQKAAVYGEDELGGLHVIQVAKYGKEAHGLPENPQKSSLLSLSKLAAPITGIAAAVTVGGLALSFLAGMGYRRRQVNLAEKRQEWNARQQARADELIADRLQKDAAEQNSQNDSK